MFWRKPLAREDVLRLLQEAGSPDKLDLIRRNLNGVDLAGVNLSGANLRGATMPDGTIHP